MFEHIKIVIISLALAMIFLGGAKAAQPENSNEKNIENKAILVTYVDRSIERKSTVTGNHRYRSRGQYSTTAWGRKIADQISKEYNLAIGSQWPITELGIYCVEYTVQAESSVERILNRLRDDDRIESAQPLNTFHTLTRTYNDPYYRLQNNIHLMQVEAAQQYSTGKDVRIVIIDTGIEQHHPDLIGQVVAEENFLLFDVNGKSSREIAGSGFQDAHGTAIAGVIGAVAGNGTGIVGIAPDAKLIALTACKTSRSHTFEATCNSLSLAQALNTAIRMKPDVINLSLGGPPDSLLRRLIDRAIDDGVIVVAAVSIKADDAISFPASMKRVIAVSNEQANNTSNITGTVVAPGLDILTTIPGGSYDYVSGSSLSAATVSGLVALMLQIEPELTLQEAAYYLKNSTVKNKLASTMTLDACDLLASVDANGLQSSFNCTLATH